MIKESGEKIVGKSVIKNTAMWERILDFLGDDLTSKKYKIGKGTLHGWKTKKHYPAKDTLDDFLKELWCNILKDNREQFFIKIIYENRIMDTERLRNIFMTRAYDEFYQILMDLLCAHQNPQKGDLPSKEKALLINNILSSKFQAWFLTESYISVESKTISERNAYIIHINNKGQLLPPIVFSYTLCASSAENEDAHLKTFRKEFIDQYQTDYLLHIAITLMDAADSRYKKVLHDLHVYLKTVQFEKYNICSINNKYVCLYFDDPQNYYMEREINIFAEILFNKYQESEYLIYKEIMCHKHGAPHADVKFFQTHLGIGNYPYAMRRAISFEKNAIETALKKMQEIRKNKIDLLIDLNCLGGLYGLRLYQYCKSVLCIDASSAVLDAITQIISTYNQNSESHETIIASTELFRDETCDILSNQNLFQKADCIVMGLGTMSFVESPDTLLRKIANWLKPDGCIFVSGYNAESLSIQINKYENLNYEYDFYNKRFVYRHKAINIPVSVKLYTFAEFRKMVMNYFDIKGDAIWSYPTICSVFPTNEFDSEIEIIKEVDKASALHKRYQLTRGNYNMILAGQYQNADTSRLYQETKDAIIDCGLNYQEINHHPFASSNELKKVLYNKGIVTSKSFIKTLLLKDISDMHKTKYYMVLLPFEQKFEPKLLEEHYCKNTREYKGSKIKLCNYKDLRNMDLTIGSVCPFSYLILQNAYPFELIYNKEILDARQNIIYTYSGRLDMTYSMPLDEFKNYLEKINAHGYFLRSDE